MTKQWKQQCDIKSWQDQFYYSAFKSIKKKFQNASSFTFPTVEKNSSKSLGLILAASCIQNTVRASLSSGVRLSIGSLKNKGEVI